MHHWLDLARFLEVDLGLLARLTGPGNLTWQDSELRRDAVRSEFLAGSGPFVIGRLATMRALVRGTSGGKFLRPPSCAL